MESYLLDVTSIAVIIKVFDCYKYVTFIFFLDYFTFFSYITDRNITNIQNKQLHDTSRSALDLPNYTRL